MTRILLAAALVLVARDSFASGDSLLAASHGALVEGPAITATVGLGGAGVSRGQGDGWLFASAAWPSATVEAGWAKRVVEGGRWVVFAGGAGIVAPRGGVTLGARAIGGAHRLGGGEFFWWRPALTLSLGAVGGQTGFTPLAPAELSIEIGLRFGTIQPYLHASGGADVLAGTHFTGRGELAIGCLFGG